MVTKKQVPAVPPNTSVAAWQDKLAQEAAAAASSETALSGFVSFRGGILNFNGQQIEGNKINVVILDSAYEHALYGELLEDGTPVSWPFDPDLPKSPNCYAMNRVESDLAPATEGNDAPELVVHENCETCPLNEWGSDPDGGKGKACKNVRRLALMDASALNAGDPEVIKKAAVVFAKLPVTSGKNYSAFVIQIANVTKRPPYGVIAELSVVSDPRTQFQVKWQFVDLVPDAFVPAIMAKKEAMADAILFTYPRNEERAAPPPARQATQQSGGTRNNPKPAKKAGAKY